jgi:DNA-binding protein HU-beta
MGDHAGDAGDGKSSRKAQVRLANSTAAAIQGGRFAYPGFGTFNVRARKARTGKNPKTGKALKIPARKVVVFRAAPGLKEGVK